MAHGLGLQVVAEGVGETRRAAGVSKKVGCDWAQGYYFSRPLPAEEIEPLCRNWKPQTQTGPRLSRWTGPAESGRARTTGLQIG